MAHVIWLTGISGAGKTTLGLILKKELEKRWGHVEFIDGDSVRRYFGNDLGYTRKERILNVKRIAFAAMLVAKNGTNVVVANIAPYIEARDFMRNHIKSYIQIYLKISVEKAMKRDVKGHYKKYKEGNLHNIVGVDDTYDIPRNPDLVIDTDANTIEESIQQIMKFLNKKGL